MILTEAKGNLAPLTTQEVKALMATGGVFSSESEVSVIPPGDREARRVAIRKVRGDTYDYFAVVSGKHAQMIFPGNDRVIWNILDSPTNIYMVKRDLKALAKFRERSARSSEFDEPYGGLSVDKVITWFRLHGKHEPFLPSTRVDVEYLRQNSPNPSRKLNPKRKLNEAWGNLQGLPKDVIQSIKSYNKVLWGSLGPAATYRKYDLLASLRDVKTDLDPRDDHFLVALTGDGWTVAPWKPVSYSEANYKTMKDVFAGIRSDNFYLITVPLKEKQRLTTRYATRRQAIDPLSGGTVDATSARLYAQHTGTFAGSLFHSDVKRVRVADLLKLSKQRNSEADNLEEAWNNFSVFPLEARRYLVKNLPSFSTKSLVVELPGDEESYVATIMKLKDQYNTAAIIGFNPAFRNMELFNFLDADAIRKRKRHPYAIVANDKLHMDRISRRVLDALKPKEEDTGGISAKNLEMWRALTGRRVAPTPWGYPPFKNAKMPMANVMKTFPKPLKEAWNNFSVFPQEVRQYIVKTWPALSTKSLVVELPENRLDRIATILKLQREYPDNAIIGIHGGQRTSITVLNELKPVSLMSLELLPYVIVTTDEDHVERYQRRITMRREDDTGGISLKNVDFWSRNTGRRGLVSRLRPTVSVAHVARAFPKPKAEDLKESWGTLGVIPEYARKEVAQRLGNKLKAIQLYDAPTVSQLYDLTDAMPPVENDFDDAAVKAYVLTVDPRRRILDSVTIHRWFTGRTVDLIKNSLQCGDLVFLVEPREVRQHHAIQSKRFDDKSSASFGGISSKNVQMWKKLTQRQIATHYDLGSILHGPKMLPLHSIRRMFPKPLKEAWNNYSIFPPEVRQYLVMTYPVLSTKSLVVDMPEDHKEFVEAALKLQQKYPDRLILLVSPNKHITDISLYSRKSLELHGPFPYAVVATDDLHMQKREWRISARRKGRDRGGISLHNLETWKRLTGRQRVDRYNVTMAGKVYMKDLIRSFPKPKAEDLEESWGELSGLPLKMRKDVASRIGNKTKLIRIDEIPTIEEFTRMVNSLPPSSTGVRYFQLTVNPRTGKVVYLDSYGDNIGKSNLSSILVQLQRKRWVFIVGPEVQIHSKKMYDRETGAIRPSPLSVSGISGRNIQTWARLTGRRMHNNEPATSLANRHYSVPTVQYMFPKHLRESWGNLKGLPSEVLAQIKRENDDLRNVQRIGPNTTVLKIDGDSVTKDALQTAVRPIINQGGNIWAAYHNYWGGVSLTPMVNYSLPANIKQITDLRKQNTPVYIFYTSRSEMDRIARRYSNARKRDPLAPRWPGDGSSIPIDNAKLWKHADPYKFERFAIHDGKRIPVHFLLAMSHAERNRQKLDESWGNLRGLPKDVLAQIKRDNIEHFTRIGPSASYTEVNSSTVYGSVPPIGTNVRYYIYRGLGGWSLQKWEGELHHGPNASLKTVRQLTGLPPGQSAYIVDVPPEEIDRIKKRRMSVRGRDPLSGGTISADLAKTYLNTAGKSIVSYTAEVLRRIPPTERVNWQQMLSISRGSRRNLKESWGELSILPEYARKEVAKRFGNKAKLIKVTKEMSGQDIKRAINTTFGDTDSWSPRFYLIRIDPVSQLTRLGSSYNEDIEDFHRFIKDYLRAGQLIYLADTPNTFTHIASTWSRKKKNRERDHQYDGISLNNIEMWSRLTKRNAPPAFCPVGPSLSVPIVRKMFPKTLKESWGNLKSLPAGAIAAVKRHMRRYDALIGPKSSYRRVSIDVPIETALDGLSRLDQHYFVGERRGGIWYVDQIGAWSPTQSFKEYYSYDYNDPTPAWVITIPRSEKDRIINRRSTHSNREDFYTGGTVKAIHAKTYVHTAAANVDTMDAHHIRHMPFPENRRVLWQDLIGISKVRKSMRLRESWGMLNDLPQEVRKAVVEWTGTEAKSYRITADMTLKQIENIIKSLPEHAPRFYIATMEERDKVYNFIPSSGDVDFDVIHLYKQIVRFPYVYLFEGGKIQAHMRRLQDRRAHVYISGAGGISIKNVGMWKKLTGRGTEKYDELTYLPARATVPVQTIRKLYPKR